MKLKLILKSKLIRSASIYTITSVINSAIPLFLMPILTRYLSPSDYGLVSMFGVLVSFLSPFIGLNLHGAISRIYYEQPKFEIQEYIANCIYILIFNTILVSFTFLNLSKFISKVSLVPTQLLWMVIVIAFAQVITQIVLALWQVQVKPIQFGVYQISNTAINMVLSLIFVVLIGLNWRGRIYAQIISTVLLSIIGFISLLKNNWLKFKWNSKYIKHALSFGVPLIPHALGGIVMTMTDRVFITNMVGIETTGVYTVGYQIGMIINLLATSFNQAYVPWLYSKLKENIMATKRKIIKFTYVYDIIIVLLAISLSLVAPPLLNYFIGKEFSGSSIFVTWIALGYAFNGMYYMVSSYIFYAQKTSYLALVTFVTAILNIILNYILISKYGAIGAAQATTIIYFIKFIFTWILSAKVYKMPWNLRNKENNK